MEDYRQEPLPGDGSSIRVTVRRHLLASLVAFVVTVVVAAIAVIGMIASIAAFSIFMFLFWFVVLVCFGGTASWLLYGFIGLASGRRR